MLDACLTNYPRTFSGMETKKPRRRPVNLYVLNCTFLFQEHASHAARMLCRRKRSSHWRYRKSSAAWAASVLLIIQCKVQPARWSRDFHLQGPPSFPHWTSPKRGQMNLKTMLNRHWVLTLSVCRGFHGHEMFGKQQKCNVECQYVWSLKSQPAFFFSFSSITDDVYSRSLSSIPHLECVAVFIWR